MIFFEYLSLVACLAAIDLVTIRLLRALLRDFLRSKKNKQAMNELYRMQSPKSKILLDYIYPLLKRNKQAFVRYRRLYLIMMFSSIPQYVVLLTLFAIYGKKMAIAFCFLGAIKIVLYFVVRANFDGCMVSIYRR